MDVVAQRVAGRRHAAFVEGELAAEQPIDPLAPVERIDAEPGDQQQVRLAGFDQDAGRHPAVVQIPGVRLDVGLGPDRAEPHAAGLALDPGDPVGQQQRRLRHADLAVIAVLRFESWPEDVRDLARGQHLQVRSRERGQGSRRGRGLDVRAAGRDLGHRATSLRAMRRRIGRFAWADRLGLHQRVGFRRLRRPLRPSAVGCAGGRQAPQARLVQAQELAVQARLIVDESTMQSRWSAPGCA